MFRQRVPTDLIGVAPGTPLVVTFKAQRGDPDVIVRATVGRTHVEFSLRTRDASVAKTRQGVVLGYLGEVWEALRGKVAPDTLTTMQAAAIGGEVYRALVRKHLEEPRTPDEWAAFKGLNRVAREGRKLPAKGSDDGTAPTITPLDLDTPWRDRRALTDALGLPIDAADHELTAAINALPVGSREAASEARYGRVVDDVLAAHGLVHGVDYESREKVLWATHEAATAAAWRLKKAAGLDFSPDPAGEARWPSVEVLARRTACSEEYEGETTSPRTASHSTQPCALTGHQDGSGAAREARPATGAAPHRAKKAANKGRGAASAAGVTWEAVYDAWAQAHRLRDGAETTRKDFGTIWGKFAKFTRVASPELVTEDHVRAWRDKRLEDGISQRTVYGADLGALGTIFRHAIRERVLPVGTVDPTTNVKPQRGATKGRRMSGYTDAEVATLLALAWAETAVTKAGALRYPARRWVPWLCALTGSRVSTMVNLRACDVKEVDGVWCIEVTSEAGPVKTDDTERVVPLHPAILEQRFVEWARGQAAVAGAKSDSPPNAAPLFYGAARRTSRGRRKGAGSRADYNPGKGAVNSLRRWITEAAQGAGIVVGTSKGRQPLHAFRHWIKTALRETGAQDSVIDAIVGHAPATVGGRYGRVTVKTMAAAMGKLAAPALPAVHSGAIELQA